MYKYYETSFKNQSLSLKEKFFNLSFSYILFIVILASIGIVVLYSAANGNWKPWAINQLIRFGMGLGVMLVFALTDIRFFMKIAYPFYFVSLLLLIYVEIRGSIGMGAQRWIDLKFFNLQPSELMKIALVMVLAKYFHSSSLQSIESTRGLIIPIMLIWLYLVWVVVIFGAVITAAIGEFKEQPFETEKPKELKVFDYSRRPQNRKNKYYAKKFLPKEQK